MAHTTGLSHTIGLCSWKSSTFFENCFHLFQLFSNADLIWKPPYFFQVIQLNNDADKVNLFCRALSVGCFLTILELFQYFHMLQKIYFFQSLLYFCSSLYQGCDILPRYIGLWPNFHRNILAPSCLKCEVYSHGETAIAKYHS